MTSSDEHSFIHGIQIAAPCHVSWDSMTGDERTRHCAACKLNVYNIASLTTAEAEALILEKEGNVCVRIFRRKDGTVITKDCPKGLAAIRARYWRSVAAVAALLSLCASYVLNSTALGSGIHQAAMLAGQKLQELQNSFSEPAATGQMDRVETRGKMAMPECHTPDSSKR